ncbi:MAG: IMP cyclohydrolase [bacterium]|nr:IMP cyclohydrolase [bacterium]
MKRALFSTTDKTGLEMFKPLFDTTKWEFISTEGTARHLSGLGMPCLEVESITRFPEMLDGRLKTLHPRIHGGILADRHRPEHMRQIKRKRIKPIDLVVVNLYNFKAKPHIENIDIGGPTLLRAAAKNAASVIVIVNPLDYEWIIKRLLKEGDIDEFSRERLARDVFEHTGQYDQMIAEWMTEEHENRRPFLTTAETSVH